MKIVTIGSSGPSDQGLSMRFVSKTRSGSGIAKVQRHTLTGDGLAEALNRYRWSLT